MARPKPSVLPVDQIEQAAQTGVALALEERKAAAGPNSIWDPINIIIGLILS